MKTSSSEHKTIFVLLIVLAFVIVGATYYYAVYPKSEAKAQMASSVDSLKSEIENLEVEVQDASQVKASTVSEFELRKKLPERRDVSQLLMSLQEIELVSEAKIVEITFNDYDALVSQSVLAENIESDENSESEESVEENSDGEGHDNVPHTNIDIASLPETLKLLSLQLDVIVQNDEDLLKFIQEIEALERVIRVDDIRFSQAGEEELSLEDPDESIQVTIQLTTFYSEIEAS